MGRNSTTHADTFDIITSNQTLFGSFSNVANGTRLTTSDGIGSFVECRSSGGNHKIVFTFANDIVSSSANLTTQSGGTISGTASFSGKTMTVNLTGVADQQTITITLNDVTDSFAQVLPTTQVGMSTLVGDTSGNGVVNGTDISQTKFQSGHPVTDANCREDIVVSGTINSTDVSQVKSRSEQGLLP